MARGKRITADQMDRIKEMYEAGYSISLIADDVGFLRKAVGKAVNRCIADGSLERCKPTIKRARSYTGRKKGITEARMKQIEVIKGLYNDGKTPTQIAGELNVSISLVSRAVNYLVENEGIQRQKRVYTQRESKPKKVVTVAKVIYQNVPSTLAEGEKVRCTPAISRTCVYGCDLNSSGLCRYSRITGKCRSIGEGACSWEACTKYSKISKNNPRLKGVDDR